MTQPSEHDDFVPVSGAEVFPGESKVVATITLIDALALIDEGLGGLTDRQLVSASEVTDLLLDVRSLIAASV